MTSIGNNLILSASISSTYFKFNPHIGIYPYNIPFVTYPLVNLAVFCPEIRPVYSLDGNVSAYSDDLMFNSCDLF